MATPFSAPPFDGPRPTQPVMVEGPLDVMALANLRIAASSVVTHVHDQVPCVSCLNDLVYCGTRVFALINQFADAQQEIDDLKTKYQELLKARSAEEVPSWPS